MWARNFHSSIGLAPGDQRLPWLTAEEGPDLLDRLVQQEQQERTAAQGSYNPKHQVLQSMRPPPQLQPAGFITSKIEPMPLFFPAAAPKHTLGVNHYSYSPLPAGAAFPPPPGSPSSLHLRLEEASLQLRGMKKERKRVEVALVRYLPGPGPNFTDLHGGGSSGAIRLPPHPYHLDRLVVDSFREYSKVITLLDRMIRMQKAPQHPGISASFKDWQDSILTLAELRSGHIGAVKADARIANYTKAVRRAKTSLWAALQHFATSNGTLSI